MQYVVLDPACGSGNFLYVAYRELRRIEADLRRRMRDMRRSAGLREQAELALYFPLTNINGIEIDPFAVQLARVTLWMGHKLAVDELDLEERVLPLVDLSGIRRGDALKLDWPRADAIIGNPPYHGDRFIRRELGDEYVEWLKREFGIGVKDYCVYWFRKAHDHLELEKRAGLVGTNSISQNRARGASLQYIVDNGGVITSAVSTQDWPGDAAVDVSIVNWVRQPAVPPESVLLDGVQVETIGPRLVAAEHLEDANQLAANRGVCFQGVVPGANYFLDQRHALRLKESASQIIRPFLSADDLARSPDQSASRWIIDFGTMSLEEAMQYDDLLTAVRIQAKPEREASRSFSRNPRWWQFLWPRPIFRNSIRSLPRFIVGTRVGKRILLAWCDVSVCPSDGTNAFALADDADIGVLLSSAHIEWARAQSSTLEDRIRYTPSSAFETFPWPAGDLTEVGEIAQRLYASRSEICLEREIGLTTLYNEVDEGAHRGLKELHDALNEAVAAAYGWPSSAAHDPQESNRLLLELNRAIAAGEIAYKPFGQARGE
jgi:hypothetical protein